MDNKASIINEPYGKQIFSEIFFNFYKKFQEYSDY